MNWSLMFVLLGSVYIWYHIIKWVPALLTCIPAMLALGFGAILMIVGIICSLRGAHHKD